MNSSALVSIIMPSYNKGKYISEAINSVVSQSCDNWELLIIDDCSTDDSIRIISDYSKLNTKITFYQNDSCKGANYSRNFGLNLAKGNYVIFFDADDFLVPNCVETRVASIEADSNIDFVVFSMGVFENKVGDLSLKWNPQRDDCLKSFFVHDLPWQTMQPIWRKKFLLKLGGFDCSFERMQDVEMHTRALLSAKVNFYCVNKKPDCFLRIIDDRKNYSDFLFLQKWVRSSGKYYLKFHTDSLKIYQKDFVILTIFATLIQLNNYLRIKKITQSEYLTLKAELFNQDVMSKIRKIHRILLDFLVIMTKFPMKIKGLNWIIRKLLII